MPGDLEFRGFELTGNPRDLPGMARRVEPGAVRIGIIADLRGRGERDLGEGLPSLAARRPIRVDRDNLDSILRRLDVNLSLPLEQHAATPLVVPLHYVEDFHPDRIVPRVEAFEMLRSIRRRLDDPRTFSEAAEELAELASPPDQAAAPDDPPPGGSLLDRMFQRSSTAPSPAAGAPGISPELGAFLREITAGHVVPDLPRQAELIAAVDAATSRLLRGVLHHPRFQAIEALWRSLDLLTRRLETGENFTIELIDATRAELEADLLSRTPIDGLASYKAIVESSVGTPGGRPWSFLVADLTFGPSARDVALLWRLGQVARLAGAPLLAAASPEFLGCRSLAATPDPDDWAAPPLDESWSDLRHGAEASYLGLVLPRFLLRAPYGLESAAIESFDFDEFDGPPDHEAYLWGNPAFAVAALLGASFDELGRFDPRRFDTVLDDLPLPLERDDEGEYHAKPCAEVLLGDRAADRMLAAGLMPLQSARERDAVHLPRLLSIGDPPAPLALG